MVNVPELVASDPSKRARWDAITAGCEVSPEAVPVICTLIYWYEIQDQCMRDITADDGIHVSYMNEMGDVKALPQIGVMKQASAEIRAIEKRLYHAEKPLLVRREDTGSHVAVPAFERARKRREGKIVELRSARRASAS